MITFTLSLVVWTKTRGKHGEGGGQGEEVVDVENEGQEVGFRKLHGWVVVVVSEVWVVMVVSRQCLAVFMANAKPER